MQRVVDVDDATCRRIDAAPETERLRRCDARAMRDTGENPADGIKITDGQRRLLDLWGANVTFLGCLPGNQPELCRHWDAAEPFAAYRRATLCERLSPAKDHQ